MSDQDRKADQTPEQPSVNDLVRAVKAEKADAFPALLSRFSPLIESMISSFIGSTDLSDADREDLRQEAMFCLYRAALSFDTDQQNVTFGLYAKTCLRNRLITSARSAKRKKRKRSPCALPDEVPATAPGKYFARCDSDRFRTAADRLLSKKERAVLDLRLSGLRYDAIAKKLGVSVKSVDNALSRAKRKLSSALNDGSSTVYTAPADK